MFLTKEEAIDVLQEFNNTFVIKQELEDKLGEIAYILKAELEDGLNLWGADDDVHELFVSVREDLQTPEYEERIKYLWEKYRIKG